MQSWRTCVPSSKISFSRCPKKSQVLFFRLMGRTCMHSEAHNGRGYSLCCQCASDSFATYGATQMCFDWLIGLLTHSLTHLLGKSQTAVCQPQQQKLSNWCARIRCVERSDQTCFFLVSKIHAADRRICNYNALQLNQNCTSSKIKFALTTKQCGAPYMVEIYFKCIIMHKQFSYYYVWSH